MRKIYIGKINKFILYFFIYLSITITNSWAKISDYKITIDYPQKEIFIGQPFLFTIEIKSNSKIQNFSWKIIEEDNKIITNFININQKYNQNKNETSIKLKYWIWAIMPGKIKLPSINVKFQKLIINKLTIFGPELKYKSISQNTPTKYININPLPTIRSKKEQYFIVGNYHLTVSRKKEKNTNNNLNIINIDISGRGDLRQLRKVDIKPNRCVNWTSKPQIDIYLNEQTFQSSWKQTIFIKDICKSEELNLKLTWFDPWKKTYKTSTKKLTMIPNLENPNQDIYTNKTINIKSRLIPKRTSISILILSCLLYGFSIIISKKLHIKSSIDYKAIRQYILFMVKLIQKNINSYDKCHFICLFIKKIYKIPQNYTIKESKNYITKRNIKKDYINKSLNICQDILYSRTSKLKKTEHNILNRSLYYISIKLAKNGVFFLLLLSTLLFILITISWLLLNETFHPSINYHTLTINIPPDIQTVKGLLEAKFWAPSNAFVKAELMNLNSTIKIPYNYQLSPGECHLILLWAFTLFSLGLSLSALSNIFYGKTSNWIIIKIFYTSSLLLLLIQIAASPGIPGPAALVKGSELYSGPDYSYLIVGNAQGADECSVIEQYGNWSLIRKKSTGQEGWIPTNLIVKIEPYKWWINKKTQSLQNCEGAGTPVGKPR